MQEEFKNGPLADWGFEGEGLVKSAKKLIKVLTSKINDIMDTYGTVISTVCMTDRN
jgi:hypothetical protein